MEYNEGDIENEELEINLNRFRRHQRKFPWRLIKNLFVVVVLSTLLYFLAKEAAKMRENQSKSFDGIEVEVD